jgi:hypothetical protein
MFRCTSCEQIDNFSLMLSAGYTGPGIFKQTVNEHGEIIINIDGYEFIPDLAFMNSHAVCKFCGSIKTFEYYFENVVKEEEKAPPSTDFNIDVDKMPEKKKRKGKVKDEGK